MAHGHSHTIAAQNDRHTNEHHIMPVKTYLTIYVSLMILTITTVGAAYVQFHPHFLNIMVAMLIASAKAILVVLYFMHQKYETRINRIFFITAFIGLGLLLGITGIDYVTRYSFTQDQSIFDKGAHGESGGPEAKAGAGVPQGESEQKPKSNMLNEAPEHK